MLVQLLATLPTVVDFIEKDIEGIFTNWTRRRHDALPTGFDGTLSPVRFEGKTCGIAAIFADSCSNTD